MLAATQGNSYIGTEITCTTQENSYIDTEITCTTQGNSYIDTEITKHFKETPNNMFTDFNCLIHYKKGYMY